MDALGIPGLRSASCYEQNRGLNRQCERAWLDVPDDDVDDDGDDGDEIGAFDTQTIAALLYCRAPT